MEYAHNAAVPVDAGVFADGKMVEDLIDSKDSVTLIVSLVSVAKGQGWHVISEEISSLQSRLDARVDHLFVFPCFFLFL